MLVVANFTENTVPCTLLKEWQDGEVLICNYSEDGEEGMLRPYEVPFICAVSDIIVRLDNFSFFPCGSLYNGNEVNRWKER